MDEKNGKWVTIHGTHIFIKDGQTPEEALAERQQRHDNLTNALVKRVDIGQLDPRNQYYIGGKRVSPREYAREMLRKALENRAEDDEIILAALNNNIDTVILKDTAGSHNDYHNGQRRLIVSVKGTGAEICTTFFHEVGHAIDYNKMVYASNHFVSPKHNMTMAQMMTVEFADIDEELLQDEYDRFETLIERVSKDYHDDKIDRKEYFQQNAYLNKAECDFVDMIQANRGERAAMKIGGWLPHRKGYFNQGPDMASTELFAELTESLQADKKRTFYYIIKQYCPKTVEIYHEILDERRKQWKIK